ncbi:hypothetical protein HDV05_006292, partial [Chytridiales sp. JEL 0842]
MADDHVDAEAIVSFVNITGASTEDATSYLQMSAGDLDTAVSLYLENSQWNAPPRSSRTEAASSSAFAGVSDDNFGVRDKIAPTRDVLVGGDDDFGPTDWSDNLRRPFHTSRVSRTRPPVVTSAFDEPPENESAGRLSRMFAPPYDIMFSGDFDGAREQAKREGKWIIVTISDRTEFQSEMLKRDLWKVPAVKDLIQAHFIFCLFTSDSPEGRKHATFYPFSHHPYFCIIDPRTGERVKVFNTVVTPEDFLKEISYFLDINSLDDVFKPKKKAKNIPLTELSEEEMLERALMESLQSDNSRTEAAKKEEVEELTEKEKAEL